MHLKVSAFITFLLICSFSPFAQDYKTNQGFRFSKEDMHNIFLDKAKSQKTKAIVTLSSGPVLTALGIFIASNHGPELGTAGGGSYSVQNSEVGTIGGIIGVAGIAATLSSIHFFISSAKFKKKANLVLTDQSTSFLGKAIIVPGIGIKINL